MPNCRPPATPALSVTSVKVPSRLFRRARSSAAPSGCVEVSRAAVDQEHIHPAVVVVIDERDAGSHGLGQIAVVGHRIVVHPRDAADRRGGFLRRAARGCSAGRPADRRQAGKPASGGEPDDERVLNRCGEVRPRGPLRGRMLASAHVGPRPWHARDRRGSRADRHLERRVECAGSIGAPAVVLCHRRRARRFRDREAQTRVTCGGCHAFPPPDILPRDAWRDEIVRMMFIRENRVPPIGAARHGLQERAARRRHAAGARLLRSRAPGTPAGAGALARSVRITVAVRSPRPGDARHARSAGGLATSAWWIWTATGDSTRSAPTCVRAWCSPPPSRRPKQRCRSSRAFRILPHVAVTDVDRDGTADLLVADLGEFFPADHDKGAVIWLRGLANGKYGAFWLDGWPRVAGVEARGLQRRRQARHRAPRRSAGARPADLAILENRTDDTRRSPTSRTTSSSPSRARSTSFLSI